MPAIEGVHAQRTKVRGAVFPVPHQFMERLFSNEKDVFVKLMRLRFLKAGQRIVFYDSGVHRLVGEAKIQNVVYDDPKPIWEDYGNRIFLDKKEFDEYINISPLGYPRRYGRVKLTAIIFKNAHRYRTPMPSSRRMTIAGHYLR